MANDLKTIVLITGANSGVGFGCASALSSSTDIRYHTIFCSRSVEKGRAALGKISMEGSQNSISLLQLDVTDANSITAARETIEKEFGRLDVLINNAGVMTRPVFHATHPDEDEGITDELRATFEANTFGPFMVSNTFLPLLKKSDHPRIIHVSSDLGSVGMMVEKKFMHPDIAYRMSKAALNMLAMYQSIRYEPFGIKVAAWNPGYTITGLGNPGMDADAWTDFRRQKGAKEATEVAKSLIDVINGARDDVLRDGILDASGAVFPW